MRRDEAQPGRQQPLGACGWGALGMCVMYMWAGMAGMEEHALPMNPGAAFKLKDVSMKSKVWKRWGYGAFTMKQ